MPASRHRHLLLVLALAAPARGAHAGPPDLAPGTTSTTSYTIEVRGRRAPPSLIADPSATVTRVPEARLARARALGEGVAALADELPGARAIDLGIAGERQLAIRGGTPGQTRVVVDGLTLATPFATGLDLGLIPTNALEVVEVVRGGAGASLGAGALGGAIVMSTRPAGARSSESLALAYGSHDTARISASARVRPIAVAASLERSGGSFAYVSRLRGLPDRDAVRENSDFARGSVALRADGELLGLDTTLALAGGIAGGGAPGLETQPELDARQRRVMGQVQALARRSLGGEGTRLELGAHAALLELALERDGPASALAAEASETTFGSAGAHAGLVMTWPPGHSTRAELRVERDSSSSTEHDVPSRLRGSAALSDTFELLGASWFAAVRAELGGEGELELLPRVGVSWAPAEGLALTLGVGRSMRAPAIDELHHPPEPGFSGNPGLRAETAWELEASARAEVGRGLPAGRLALFARSTSDTILYVNRNAFEIRPENAGGARSAGAELEVSHAAELPIARVAVAGSASLLFAELSATGEPIPTHPAWSGFLRVGLERGGVGAEISGRVFAATTANLQGTIEAPAFVRLDAAASWAPVAGATLALSVANLLDDPTLVTVHKVPLPGRTAMVSLSIEAEGAP